MYISINTSKSKDDKNCSYSGSCGTGCDNLWIQVGATSLGMQVGERDEIAQQKDLEHGIYAGL